MTFLFNFKLCAINIDSHPKSSIIVSSFNKPTYDLNIFKLLMIKLLFHKLAYLFLRLLFLESLPLLNF